MQIRCQKQPNSLVFSKRNVQTEILKKFGFSIHLHSEKDTEILKTWKLLQYSDTHKKKQKISA